MTQVKLERFSLLRSPNQAVQLNRLAQDNADWLVDSPYSGAIDRYGRGLLRATRQVIRVSDKDRFPHFDPYLIKAAEEVGENETSRPDWRAVGVGTIITYRAIGSVDMRNLSGTDVDYWLDVGAEDQHPEVHLAVGRAMLRTAIETTRDVVTQPDSITVFTTMEPYQEHQPTGFESYMQPDGQTGPVSTSSRDIFGLDKGGRDLQIYRYDHILGEPLPDAPLRNA